MKIFNIEKGEHKIYIQKEDLITLCETTIVPQSIYDIYKFSFIDSKSNKDFVEYSNPNDIDYLNSIDWILDYRKYSAKSIEELYILLNHYKYKIQELSNLYNEMSNKERKQNYNLKIEYEHLKHKYNSLISFTNLIKNEEKINFPIKKDYLGITFENNSIYILYPSLDKNTYIIERKDNKSIEKSESINNNFIDDCIKYIVFYCLDNEDINSIKYYYDEKEKNIKIKIKYNIKENIDINNVTKELKENNSYVKKLINKFKRD